MLTLPSPTTVHTRINDNWLFVFFFYYSHYYLSLVFYYLVSFFIKYLYHDLLNFSFCKNISFYQQAFVQSYCSTRSIAIHILNSYKQILAGWDPRNETLDVLVLIDFTFKTCICVWYIKNALCQLRHCWQHHFRQLRFCKFCISWWTICKSFTNFRNLCIGS